MGLKYVLNSMKRRKLRTLIIAIALTIGVALVGALLALVDTQRQFSIQSVGAQTGGYDLSITKRDLADTPFFNIAEVAAQVQAAYSNVVDMHPRIQGTIEARKVGALDGQAVTFVAVDPNTEKLVSVAPLTATSSSGAVFGIRLSGIGGRGGGGGGGGPPGVGKAPGAFQGGGGQGNAQFGGQNNNANTRANGGFGQNVSSTYPPEPGQVFLDTTTAGALGVRTGDTLLLSYAVPTPREVGKAVITGTSAPRAEANLIVSGVGVLDGLNTDIKNPLVMRLEDAQAWLDTGSEANQLLLVWQSKTSTTTDPRTTVTDARNIGEIVRDELQAKLGPDFVVSLPKYTRLENAAQSFAFTQTFITLYGMLSMGIVGLMVNALMTTTVAEQKFDLAVLRVIGSPRIGLYQIVIIEVALLGVAGIVLGLLLGRAINDYLMVPILLANLQLPAGVRADWTLQTVLIPTAITIGVLAIATISPARAAARTKVMLVLNPAAADQPTLDDLAKLRERRADIGLLIVGLVLLAFSAFVLIVLPTVFTPGNATGQVGVTFGSLLLMVIGMSLLFYFVTTPLERMLVRVYRLFSAKAAYFAGRYAMRGKGRNALISLMVVTSGVLPTLLATQLAVQEANLETDSRFNNGAPFVATPRSSFGGAQIFRRFDRGSANLSNDDVAAVLGQPGIGTVVGVAEGQGNTPVSDRIQLRSARISLLGVEGDMNTVLYGEVFHWTEGNASALARVVTDTKAAIISQGLSQALDLHVGDTLRVQGAGTDHEMAMTIIGVASRVPGFVNYFSRNSTEANGSGVFINMATYRELTNNPALGSPDPTKAVFTRLMATIQPGVNEGVLLADLRRFLGGQNDMTVVATSEQIATTRTQLEQSRVFIVLLTGLSMLTAIFGVLAVMYTAVVGRRIEIGMLKAVGASKGALRGIFVGEALITTLAAGVAGIIAGTILGYAFELSQRLQTDRPVLLAFDFSTAGLIVALVCLASIFSATLATQPVIRQKAITILRER